MGQEAVGERKGQRSRCRGESGINVETAFWPRDYGVETSLLPFPNGQIQAERLQCGGEFVGIGSFRGKAEQGAAFRRILRRVNGIRAPLNEERQEAAICI